MLLPTDTIDTLCVLARQATPMSLVKLVQLVDSLSAPQRAELMVLLWLGRDGGDFGQHLERALKSVDDAVGYYMAEQGAQLADYLRSGCARINQPSGREE